MTKLLSGHAFNSSPNSLRLTAASQAREADKRLSLEQTSQGKVTNVLFEAELTPALLENCRRYGQQYLRLLHAFITNPLSDDFLNECARALADLLPEPMRNVLEAELKRTAPTQLHLNLYLEPSELSGLPWELLPLGLSARNSSASNLYSRLHILRQAGNSGDFADSAKIRPLTSPPLRILVAWADPCSAGYPALPYLQAERANISSALYIRKQQGGDKFIEIDELPYATPASLERALKERTPHVLHFIGHGAGKTTGGGLILHGEQPNTDVFIYGDVLARWLTDTSVRMVVLSACHTDSPRRGVARVLSESGIPAVVAMQMPWRDTSAGTFMYAFYEAVKEGLPVDIAVLKGRQALYKTLGDPTIPAAPSSERLVKGGDAAPDWAVPVLYLREDYGGLFRFPPPLPRHNLPVETRRFIGRQQELKDLRQRLANANSRKKQRLVTLTAIGGMGKSRLARRAAEDMLRDFPDGVWLVECGELTSDQELITSIGAVLSQMSGAAGLDPNKEPVEALITNLKPHKTLLILDGFEKLVRYAPLLERLLSHTPDLSLLLTSREPLLLDSEFEYRVNPLSDEGRGLRQLSDSMSLFAEAATHSVNRFKVTTNNRSVIRDICTALDGIPLALTLAASWLRDLTLEELLEKTRDERFDVLRRRAQWEGRHSVLSEIVADSVGRLPKKERTLLYALSVFVGSFALEDVQIVCAAEDDRQLQQADFEEGLRQLQAYALLQPYEQNGKPRFRLLDTIREYLEQTTKGSKAIREAQERAHRHANHYATTASNIGILMRQGHWKEGREKLWQEMSNLRTAIQFSITNENREAIVELAAGLAHTFFEAGLWSDFEVLTQAGEGAAQHLGRKEVNAQLLGLLGALAVRRGEQEEGRRLWLQRMRLCEEMDDRRGSTDIIFELAWQSFQRKRIAEARHLLLCAEKMAQIYRLSDMMAAAKAIQAEIQLAAGDRECALLCANLAQELLQEEADRGSALAILSMLGRIYREVNDFPRAQAAFKRMLAAALEGERAFHVTEALLGIGLLFERNGQWQEAARAYFTANAVSRTFVIPLRNRAVETQERFSREHDSLELRKLLSTLQTFEWRDLAMELAA